MALIGCEKKRPCPKQEYPSINAIDKIPYYEYWVSDGVMDVNSTMRAFMTIKALRVSENYYYKTIYDYRKEFIDGDK